MSKTPRKASGKPAQTTFDPVTLAILNKRFEAVTSKMANTLLRSGRSGVLNLARDFSTSIVTRDCELLAGAESLPIHHLSGADLMARAMLDMHPNPAAGDAYLHNSPYHGGSHPADHTILVPVVDRRGVHRFTIWVKAHQADCGNALPTTYMGEARDVYAEGALIFPAVKVQSGYHDIEDIVRMCEMRIRVPGQWRGDYLAMVGAARIGEREVLAMGEEYGWETLDAFAAEWFDYSERTMAAALRRIPGGRVSASSCHDPIPGTPPEGILITSHVQVDSRAGHVHIDLSDNPDAMPCGLNLSEACARTAAMMAVFYSLQEPVPSNAGSFRRIHVHLREQCIVGGGRHPTSMSASTTNLADRVTNATQRAFSMLADGIGLAEAGPIFPASMGVISGLDPRRGNAPYVNQLFLLDTGGPAAPTVDGWLTICHAGNAGMCFIDSVELDELHFPLIVHERRLLPDTEGAGRTLGSPSGYCEYGPVGDNTMEVAFIADGALNPALGTRGGEPGAKISNFVRRADGKLEPLPAFAVVALGPGERVASCSAGGGGYGLPMERPPERVQQDVAEKWVSRARARTVYGVSLAADNTLDPAATARLRTSPPGRGVA
jgi:N-methylhydantoinase B